MTLRFTDSFDHYSSSQISRKWTLVGTTAPTITASGRFGGSCIRFGTASVNCHVTLTLDNQASWVIGLAFKCSALPAGACAIIQLLDAASAQCEVRINTDGTLSVTRNGTALTSGTSSLSISAGAWYYLEFKVTIADSIAAGSCKVRINGVDWITVATGQDVKNTTNATANQIRVGEAFASGTSFNLDVDDLYIFDGNASTPANNDFIGDARVECLNASGAGANTTWTPNAGTNWSRVSDATPDDDTTYVADSTAGHRDSYAFANLSSTPVSIFGTQTVLCARKDDAGSRSIATVCVSGATTDDGASISIGDTYLFYMQIRERNPNGPANWTLTTVNAAEWGEKLVS